MPTACPDTPTLVTGSYFPQAKFAFNRGYLRQIALYDRSSSVVMVDNLITCFSTDLPGLQLSYLINPKVWEWNTNVYTLDFVLCDAWYQYDAEPFHHEWGANVTFDKGGDPVRWELRIEALFSSPIRTTLPIPPAPPDYWINQPQ